MRAHDVPTPIAAAPSMIGVSAEPGRTVVTSPVVSVTAPARVLKEVTPLVALLAAAHFSPSHE